jgi:lauroyl/myristoyl acyltransferase
MLNYWGFRFLSYLAGQLPIRLSYLIADWVGNILYFVWRRPSRNAVANMRHVLTALEPSRRGFSRIVPGPMTRRAQTLARRSLRNYARFIVEVMRYNSLSSRKIASLTDVRGWQNIEAALAKGKGAIVISYHFGNWDYAGATLNHRYPNRTYCLADTLEPPGLDAEVNGRREAAGMRIIRLNNTSMRQIFTALKEKNLVILLLDVPSPDDGIAVNFFGGRAFFPPGPAAISLKTGAPIVPGYAVRSKELGRFSGVIEPAVEYTPIDDKQQDIQALTQLVVNRMEATVRKHPDQWYMFRPMWPQDEMSDEESNAEVTEELSQQQPV